LGTEETTAPPVRFLPVIVLSLIVGVAVALDEERVDLRARQTYRAPNFDCNKIAASYASINCLSMQIEKLSERFWVQEFARGLRLSFAHDISSKFD